jgi:hypothetical protein
VACVVREVTCGVFGVGICVTYPCVVSWVVLFVFCALCFVLCALCFVLLYFVLYFVSMLV